jgi:glycosyltransferase involved in cell wall biosynthesis
MDSISIITINLNNLQGLKKTMTSVFEQTYAAIDYIIIDGGSTDGSNEWIKKYKYKLGNWVSDRDKGIYDAQNKGWKMAKGKYCIFLNSGDRFYNKHTVTQLAYSATRNSIVYGNIFVEDVKGNLTLKEYPSIVNAAFLNYDTLPHCCTLIPTPLLRIKGGYDTSLRICADWHFFRRVWRAGLAKFVHVPEAYSIFENGGLSALPQSKQDILMERQRVIASEKTLPARVRRKVDNLLSKFGLWIPHW